MTHSGGKPHTNVGDRGQRYEVRAYFERSDSVEDQLTVIGWTNEANGGSLLERAKKWPCVNGAHIVDRGVQMLPPYSED